MGGLVDSANAATNANAGSTIAGGGLYPGGIDRESSPILSPFTEDAPRVAAVRQAPAETSRELSSRLADKFSQPRTEASASSLFEQRVKGTALAGKQPFIDSLAQKHDVPPEVAKAIIALETGWGKSLKGNNPAGIMDSNSPNQTKKVAFSSIEAGLERSMQVIAKNYHKADGDLRAMNLTYAPPGAKNDPNNTNRFWARDVNSIATRLGYAPQPYSTAAARF